MDKTSVVPLITLWEEFLEKMDKGDLEQFVRWVLTEGKIKSAPAKKKISFTSKNGTETIDENGKVLFLINRIDKFMQRNTKPVLKKLGFAREQEYSVLLQVNLIEQPNKKLIAEQLLMESTTTVEITNRLVRRGLIKESTDSTDKRATLLRITDKGQKIIHESFDLMRMAHHGVLDGLSVKEISQLVKLLEKIEKQQSGK
jgi:DNA-binding MarR family transcriptional regulator